MFSLIFLKKNANGVCEYIWHENIGFEEEHVRNYVGGSEVRRLGFARTVVFNRFFNIPGISSTSTPKGMSSV